MTNGISNTPEYWDHLGLLLFIVRLLDCLLFIVLILEETAALITRNVWESSSKSMVGQHLYSVRDEHMKCRQTYLDLNSRLPILYYETLNICVTWAWHHCRHHCIVRPLEGNFIYNLITVPKVIITQKYYYCLLLSFY